VPEAVLEVADLRKTYRDGLLRRRTVEALRGVSFRVERGEIFGLLGPNGAGKTTLLKVLLGVVRRTGGEARLLGRPAGDRQGRRRVGYLPEHHRIPRHHTGNSALLYYGALSGLARREIRRRAPELLSAVGLAEWGRTAVRKYSKGMQQRLGLAQALLHDPELVILDEPTDGVDPVGRSELRSLLVRLKEQGKTVFLNSHLLQEVELVCDRVAILDRGELLRVGKVAELTVAPGTEVELELLGDDAQVRAGLDGADVQGLVLPEPGRWQAVLQVADQRAIDAVVDRLRARGVSIASMARRRRTLEEAFLKILRGGGTA
jgi:ABC-2 type transport system ATP-binding protein